MEITYVSYRCMVVTTHLASCPKWNPTVVVNIPHIAANGIYFIGDVPKYSCMN